MNLYEESPTNLGLISPPVIHECTAFFYNCHVVGIEFTMSNSSSVVVGMPMLIFVAVETTVA
jgi:hypothetical protein